MSRSSLNLVILGGPNGAGKTTISREVLDETLGVVDFVNADVIASGLSGFNPEQAAFTASRIMLARLKELASARADFAFETTLASRTFAPWIRSLAESGYKPHLVYVWLRSPRLAASRVRGRIRKGGHSIPEPVIYRRYARSASNLFNLYIPLIDAARGTTRIYDNSGSELELLATRIDAEWSIYNARVFDRLNEVVNAHEEKEPDDR